MANLFVASTLVVFLTVWNGLYANETQIAPLLFSSLYLPYQDICRGVKNSKQICLDCGTLVRCENNAVKYEINCKSQNSKTPYCANTKGTCAADKSDCADPSPIIDFICPSAGLYPDISDCHKYISCPAKDRTGITYLCKEQSVYDHRTPACITGASCNNEIKNCGTSKKIILYRSDMPSLYIVCNSEEGKHSLEDCGKGKKYDFDIMRCTFDCKSEGRFPDPSDNTNQRYYECTRYGTKLVASEEVCPGRTKFNNELKACVD